MEEVCFIRLHPNQKQRIEISKHLLSLVILLFKT